LPTPEQGDEFVSHLGGELFRNELPGEPYRDSHLREVLGAMRAAREMRLESAAISAGQGIFQVVGDQLNGLLAD
jgi:hypothetical protein